MQGIQFTEFKKLLTSLSSLTESDTPLLPEAQLNNVIENEKKLKEIYGNYLLLLKQLSENVRQFESHKQVIRKLMKEHRQYLKYKEKSAVAAPAE